ncbi:Uncharacterized protein TCM_037203 isoform 2, partial [Theobroma cacao]
GNFPPTKPKTPPKTLESPFFFFKILTLTFLFCFAFSRMASRFRSLSKPTFSILKSTLNKPSLKPRPASSLLPARSSPTFSRSVSQLGCLQSLLPLHSAVSSARLTSCLGIDSRSSRSLSQGMLCSANPGV